MAGRAAVLAGAADSLGARRLPVHLLLLPRRLLQGVLGRSARPAPSASRGRATAASARSRSILQNVHRYFLYLALLFLIVLWRDVWKALWFTDPATGATTFGIGVGTLVLAVNVVLLGGYTFGCHSLRHLVGGLPRSVLARIRRGRRCTTARAASTAATCAGRGRACSPSRFADLYVRLCSMGIWTDWRIL